MSQIPWSSLAAGLLVYVATGSAIAALTTFLVARAIIAVFLGSVVAAMKNAVEQVK